MNTGEALAACEASVRRADPDRYFSGLFVPGERRSLLYALYAFDHEIARLREVVREPMMREIRLAWWREAIETAQEGRPRAHPGVIGLAELFARGGIEPGSLQAMIEAHARAWSEGGGRSLAQQEAHAEAVSGALLRIAAHVVARQSVPDNAIKAAGTALGLLDVLRHVPRASQERAPIVAAARNHFAAARKARFGAALPVVMPAALVPLYLGTIERGGDPREVPLFRRQAVFLRCALTGRL